MNQRLIAFLVFSCISNLVIAQKGYTIKGNITGLPENSKIYLIDGGRRKTIDSTIVKNESFVLKGVITEAAHTYLYHGKSNKLADILLDNREILVTGTQPIYDSIKIIGSDIDDQWKEWYNEDQRIGYLRYRLIEVSEALLKKGDTDSANKLKKITEELANERVSLLKASVKKYGKTPAGAVLPTLCTIQEQLTKSDILEMYNSLSAEMQNTYLGNEIKKIAAKK